MQILSYVIHLIINHVADPTTNWQSLKAPGPYPSKIWLEHRELYLSDAAFVAQFNMNKAQFKALPQWRQNKLKKEAGLF